MTNTKRSNPIKAFILTAIVTLGVASTASSVYATPTVTSGINVMGPLLIGDPHQPDSANSEQAWKEFATQLAEAKKNGIAAVSTDIWWGLVEPQKNAFEWRYYEKMAEVIEKSGLKWVPILSFHQLGGNVGDKGFIPLPEWVWQQGYYQTRSTDPTTLMFKSENGQVSREYVSFWATDIMAPRYEMMMVAFRAAFANKAHLIKEINISMGPAGELRYPSYNMHDGPSAGYPHRGAIQAYSGLAVESFRNFVQSKYSSIAAVNSAWGFSLTSFDQVYPPNPEGLKGNFFKNNEHFSPYGKDFFDWYNESLVRHSRKMLSLAKSVFHASDSVMPQVELGAKIPGVHWRVGSDRLAELSAGLIRTSYGNWYSNKSHFGYLDTLKAFEKQGHRVALHFTATELPDREYEQDLKISSRAQTLTKKIGEAAKLRGITLKGENALSWTLYDAGSFERMQTAITHYGFSEMTLLRWNEIVGQPEIVERIRGLSESVKSAPMCRGIFQ